MKQFFTFLCALLSVIYSYGQCLPNGITFTTQEQIDNFATDYPGCTEVLGDVIIGINDGYFSSDIVNLNGLNQIESIGGHLSLTRNENLVNLQGLSNLNTVGDALYVSWCHTLSDLSGLDNLTKVGDVSMYSNEVLTSLVGLQGLDTINGSLHIEESEAINNLVGLQNIRYIAGELRIRDSDITDLSELSNLNFLGEHINISNNGSLQSLIGLEGLDTLHGGLYLGRNHLLTDLTGLDNVVYIGNNVQIASNFNLKSLSGLDNVKTIKYDIRLQLNTDLVNLEGLESLTSLKGMNIDNNDAMTSLNGLGNITSVIQNVSISKNSLLNDITALQNIEYISQSLYVRDNTRLINFEGLNNLDTIGLSMFIYNNSWLTDFSGLSNLTYVGETINISNNYNLLNLTGLEGLTTVGDNFIVENNSALIDFSGASNLNTIHGYFKVKDNPKLLGFDGLDSLNSIVGDFLIENNNKIEDLSGIENLVLIGGQFDLRSNNELTNFIGLNNLTTITGTFSILDNAELNSFENLPNIAYVGGYEVTGNTSLQNLHGMDSLHTIGSSIEIRSNSALNSIEALNHINSINGEIIIIDNTELTSLSGLENIDFNGITNVQIHDNPNLVFCGVKSICDYMIAGADYDIFNNTLNCNDFINIIYSCTDYGGIQNFTFYDNNQNKVQDNNEPYVQNIPLIITPDNLSIYTNDNNLYLLNANNYTVNLNLDSKWTMTTDSLSYFVTVNAGEYSPVHFGIYPNDFISHIQTIITSPPTRCNEWITFDVTTKNIGTTVTNGTTWFQMSHEIISYSFVDYPDVSNYYITPIFYGWNFTDLYPSQSLTWQVNIKIPGPPDFPVGDVLNFGAFTEYTDVNGMHTSEGFRYIPEVLCSYDPNDKLVSPTRYHNEVLLDEDLIYTVRFQNTGNDVAYDVKILDTLDANLDVSTFRVLGSSHSEVLNTSLDDEGVITFDFRNIFLPDSTSNLEGSNGYVTYMIHTLEGIDENTVIRNSAGIYFDQNPPVLTNITRSVMVSMLTSTTTPDLFPDLIIFPNPNTGTFQIEGIPRGTYQLLNTTGQIIQTGQLENGTLIDISEAAQGVYFMQMLIDEHIVTRRVVKL